MAYDPARDYRTGSRSSEMVPARNGFAITPADADLPLYAKSLYIGVAGDVSYVPIEATSDTPIVAKNHPVGYSIFGARRVTSATTATQILGFR